jgi:hypothetical protein
VALAVSCRLCWLPLVLAALGAVCGRHRLRFICRRESNPTGAAEHLPLMGRQIFFVGVRTGVLAE